MLTAHGEIMFLTREKLREHKPPRSSSEHLGEWKSLAGLSDSRKPASGGGAGGAPPTRQN